MTTRTTRKAAPSPEPRIRFNWGFWQGLHDRQDNRRRLWGKNGASHFDRTYEAGYWAGQAAASDAVEPTTSDAAWAAHRAAR